MNNHRQPIPSDNNQLEKQPTCSVIIVTGLSGAGKSSTLRALEDLGFYCVDNLPVPLLSQCLKLITKTESNLPKLAFGIDARGGSFLNTFVAEIKKLKQAQTKLDTLGDSNNFPKEHSQVFNPVSEIQEEEKANPS